MKRLKKYFPPLITGVIIFSLNSCTSEPTNRKTYNASSPATETINTVSVTQLNATGSTSAQAQEVQPAATQPLKATNTKVITSIAQSIQTVPVKIYRADSQCQSLVSEKVPVPAGNLLDSTVGKVLQEVDSGDFDLVGYRVNINAKSRVATVDLRLSPDSQRQFVSLSMCEQFALFGSLRKTLTSNSQLKIQAVRFTQQGKEIKV